MQHVVAHRDGGAVEYGVHVGLPRNAMYSPYGPSGSAIAAFVEIALSVSSASAGTRISLVEALDDRRPLAAERRDQRQLVSG